MLGLLVVVVVDIPQEAAGGCKNSVQLMLAKYAVSTRRIPLLFLIIEAYIINPVRFVAQFDARNHPDLVITINILNSQRTFLS